MRNKKLVAVAMTRMMVCAMGNEWLPASPIENLQGTDSKRSKGNLRNTVRTRQRPCTASILYGEICSISIRSILKNPEPVNHKFEGASGSRTVVL